MLNFRHLKNIFKTGLHRPIENRDIYETLDDHKSTKIVEQYEKEWKYEKAINEKSPNFFKCIFRMYGFSIFVLGALRGLSETTTA